MEVRNAHFFKKRPPFKAVSNYIQCESLFDCVGKQLPGAASAEKQLQLERESDTIRKNDLSRQINPQLVRCHH